MYDPTKRFEFTNISDTDFEFKWNGTPIVVKPGKKVILKHHLAVLAATKLCDQLMMADINKRTEEERAKNPMYIAPNRAGSLGVPAARKPYEDKILRELPKLDDNDAQLGIIRSETIEQLTEDLSSQPAPRIEKMSDIGVTSIKEFEDINLPTKG